MNSIKKISVPLFLLSLCLTLYACTEKSAAAESRFTAKEIAAAILASQDTLPDLEACVPGDAEYATYIDLYLPQLDDSVKDGVICYPFGVEATEVAVFLFQSEEAAEAVRDSLQAYLDSRVATFIGYAPEQAALAETGQVVINGKYAALFICADPVDAESAFMNCFGNTAPTLALEEILNPPSEKETRNPELIDAPMPDPNADIYDHDAVLAAWLSGNSSDLTEKNRTVLEAAGTVIAEVIADSMTDYAKELAIHDWMIGWADYDADALNPTPSYVPDPDSETPYGFFQKQKGICRGYTSTFQLLMDMLGIECVTVQGYAYNRTEEHAWNMVRLDGDWYCVDVTWDDPVTSGQVSVSTAHRYFNVTSDYMRLTNHQWDESTVEKAEGTAHRWYAD